MTTENQPSSEPAPTSTPSDEQKNTVKALVKEALHEYIEENRPGQDKTQKPAPGLFTSLFGAW